MSQQCPTCHGPIRELGRALPYSMQEMTYLKCSVTDQILNEHNIGFAMPNGKLISKDGVALLKGPSKNQPTFMFEGEEILEKDLQRVYLL